MAVTNESETLWRRASSSTMGLAIEKRCSIVLLPSSILGNGFRVLCCGIQVTWRMYGHEEVESADDEASTKVLFVCPMERKLGIGDRGELGRSKIECGQ